MKITTTIEVDGRAYVAEAATIIKTTLGHESERGYLQASLLVDYDTGGATNIGGQILDAELLGTRIAVYTDQLGPWEEMPGKRLYVLFPEGHSGMNHGFEASGFIVMGSREAVLWDHRSFRTVAK